ncbi:MAG: hypothetical protein WCP87_05080 [Atribacterota bacterium]
MAYWRFESVPPVMGVDLLTRQAVGMRGVIPQLSPIFICLGVL